MRPDFIIWDCDGVLIDSEIISAQMLIEALAGFGVTIDRAFVVRHFLGRSYPRRIGGLIDWRRLAAMALSTSPVMPSTWPRSIWMRALSGAIAAASRSTASALPQAPLSSQKKLERYSTL